jgi:hypothetical protein
MMPQQLINFINANLKIPTIDCVERISRAFGAPDGIPVVLITLEWDLVYFPAS